jgi:VanZ family protein
MQPARDTRQGLLLAALGLYLLIAACIAFWPTPVDQSAGPWLASAFDRLHTHGIPGWINYDLLEFVANVVFFFPLTFILTILLGRRRWRFALVIGVAASISIELCQLFFIAERFASIADVLANALGSAVGCLLAQGTPVRSAEYEVGKPRK